VALVSLGLWRVGRSGVVVSIDDCRGGSRWAMIDYCQWNAKNYCFGY
jgi:hypothetical protein